MTRARILQETGGREIRQLLALQPFSHAISRPLTGLCLLLALAVPGKARAEDGDHLTIGAGVAAVPDFEGADDYRVHPFPLLDVKIGRIFANVADGIGYNVIDLPGFEMGASLTYVRGYRRRDVPDGVDRLSDAAGGRLFARLRQGRLSATIGATRSFAGGTRGVVAGARLSYAVDVDERLTIIPTLATSWANGKHMRRYFGISPSEVAASGLSPYRPSSGFKDISALATANYRLAGGLSLTGSTGVSRLLDKAADSPLVEQRWQPTGFVGVSYSF